jgi:hypothetical protein
MMMTTTLTMSMTMMMVIKKKMKKKTLWVYSLARDQEKDLPMVVTYALVGNDVCNG